MLRSYDAKQCSFRNHKAESITGVGKKTEAQVALKQKVPVPLKQTKMRKNAGKAQVIGDTEYSKMMDGLLNQN